MIIADVYEGKLVRLYTTNGEIEVELPADKNAQITTTMHGTTARVVVHVDRIIDVSD